MYIYFVSFPDTFENVGDLKKISFIPSTPCPRKKVSHLMFDNNFGKCGPIFKIFHQVIRTKILYVRTAKISTSPAICCYTTL